jgi:hypothetical protein
MPQPSLKILAALLALGTAASARDRIAGIEFYGYKGIDAEAVRKALPVHEGDAYSDAVKGQVQEAVKRTTGRDATDVAGICCNAEGDRVVFIGVPGESSRTFALNPQPTGKDRLSAKITVLSHKMDQAEEAAVRKGGAAAQEEGSDGYRLVKDPAARRLELAVRRYALRHQAELLRVLESSSDAEQRGIAADVLGYGRRSPQQVAALVRASRDPDDNVRNNATRALGELVSAGPEIAKQIPSGTFVDMLRSGIWTDRNKASFLLMYWTQARDPGLLEQLKAQALDALIEIARWRDTGHAIPARLVLGRIAGIPEDRLVQLAPGDVQVILDSLARR